MNRKNVTLLAIQTGAEDLYAIEEAADGVKEWDVEFLGFTNPALGRAALARRVVNVVFLDARLRDPSAAEIVRHIRNTGDARPVIMFVDSDDEFERSEFLRAGASDYLVRGRLTSELLRRAVEGVLTQFHLQQEKLLLEEELRQSQMMETVGRLAGGIAHDFNNMLMGIMGSIELALLKSQGRSVCDELLEIKQTCRHMAELIQRLLSFSRRRGVERAAVSVGRLIGEIEVVLRHSTPKNVQLEIEIPSDPLTVHGNPGMLHQVLLNLAVNGAESMPDGGTLRVRGRRAFVDAASLLTHPGLSVGEYVVLEVADQGVGIDPKDLDRIFEPFFTTKRLSMEKGTGLGLAIAWQNVREHEGTIKVYSEVGRGTTFRVYLPAASEVAAQRPEGAQEDFPPGSETILLVDDERLVSGVVAQVLQRLGYKVYCAYDGIEAIDIYQELLSDVALVILDISMPRMNGIECLGRLLEIDPNVRVLLSSGHDIQPDESEFRKMGAKGAIQKPYQLLDLAKRLRVLIEQDH